MARVGVLATPSALENQGFLQKAGAAEDAPAFLSVADVLRKRSIGEDAGRKGLTAVPGNVIGSLNN